MATRELDIKELYREAQNRWLKPAEVYFLLQNYGKQHLMQENPQKPPSGSLFLFNRRVHRFFRKDGYAWRKKRDGRTVGEAHERLKVGNEDALNCYYAHGEQNPNFQRRSYWMLNQALEHIVLVHYREVTEGRHSGGSIMSFSTESTSPFSQSTVYNAQIPNGQHWSSLSPGGSVDEVSSKLVSGNKYLEPEDLHRDMGTSSQQEVNHALRRLEEQLSLDNDDIMSYMEKLPPYSDQEKESKYSGALLRQSSKQDETNNIMLSQFEGDRMNFHGQHSIAKSWTNMLEVRPSSSCINAQGQSIDKLSLKAVTNSSEGKTISSFEKLQQPANVEGQPQKMNTECHQTVTSEQNGTTYYAYSEKTLSRQLSEARRFLLESDDPIDASANELIQEVDKSALSTYSSGASSRDTNSTVLTRQEANNVEWMEAGPGIVNNFEMWFDQESHLETPLALDASLTLAQVQRFHIREVSPDWAYSSERTKVIVTGDFLCNPSECFWACMFGDIEVPVEVIQHGVLRCYAPLHSSGRVSFCVTCGNREACSEVREFEFRPEPQTLSVGSVFQQREENKTKEELALLARFAEVLLLGFDSVTVQKEDSVESGTELFRRWRVGNDPWGHIIEALIVGNATSIQTLKWMVEELLKDKLQRWALPNVQSDGVADCTLSKQEQGMIHMIAALGYEWALNPILSCGVGVNFRDINGWTALHWAARFGREKMVAALLAAGASAGAVTDPTSQNLSGCSPASIAAASGHKGLAGYLSEVALTSHLSSLTIEENEISKYSAAVEAERTLEMVSDRSVQLLTSATEDQLSLKDSLAAVRNAAQAAARIQAAFRAHSFRKRQERAALSIDEYSLSPDEISVLSKLRRVVRGLPASKLNHAALSIQKNYRGWKGRKEFINLRQNVVKIQAHVRGHQVRKKYREFLWTVGVLEKVILRWRRRGMGLRGFKSEQEPTEGNEEEEEDEEKEEDDILKVFRKQKVDTAIDEAVSRVLSMVKAPEARQQYRRMLERYRQAKAELGNNGCEARLTSEGNSTNMENEDYMYNFS
ncbi:hypothetical protein H6P81_012042 [Aristolochia fimbriata]|uniref:CG-1 domain-containing protein n=1 Tax=Aristolochia fimbriata TaxID=158543 RepID=A0AAV7ECC7_ARIFI|nr:hypothetical protein H6P81_012042 [Aristolochia fimbriata]